MAKPRILARDGVLALVVLLIGLLGASGAGQFQHHRDRVGALAYLLVVVAALALVLRRIWPLVTLAVAAPATSRYLVFGYPYGLAQIPLVVAVFTVARRIPLRWSAVACGVVSGRTLNRLAITV